MFLLCPNIADAIPFSTINSNPLSLAVSKVQYKTVLIPTRYRRETELERVINTTGNKCKSINVQDGATLTFNPGMSLEVDGSMVLEQ